MQSLLARMVASLRAEEETARAGVVPEAPPQEQQAQQAGPSNKLLSRAPEPAHAGALAGAKQRVPKGLKRSAMQSRLALHKNRKAEHVVRAAAVVPRAACPSSSPRCLPACMPWPLLACCRI
jgi:hypothetical protein